MLRETDFERRMRCVFGLALTTARGPKDHATLYAQAERKWQRLLKREARDLGMDFKWFMREYGDWLQISPRRTCARCLEIGKHCLAHSTSSLSQLCGCCKEEMMDRYQIEHRESFVCEDCGETTPERRGRDGGRTCEPCFSARPRNARFHFQRRRNAYQP